MTSPRVTVALSDIAAFTARYGLSLVRVGETVGGLPECEWKPDAGQTSEQAALVAQGLKDGKKWQAIK